MQKLHCIINSDIQVFYKPRCENGVLLFNISLLNVDIVFFLYNSLHFQYFLKNKVFIGIKHM